MTIHSTHPFRDPEPDPVRRLRGHLGGAVTLWTAGGPGPRDAAGLTVSSVLVAAGEPGRLLALLDPDSDLAAALRTTGRAAVSVLQWEHRDLAEMFAGTAPAPGGPFQQATFAPTPWGPRLESAASWVGVRLESTAEVGWSLLATCLIDRITLGETPPLRHRRGRYQPPSPG